MRDEGFEYAERLRADGVSVTHRNYEEMIHGFVSLTGVVPQANDCFDELASAIADSVTQ